LLSVSVNEQGGADFNVDLTKIIIRTCRTSDCEDYPELMIDDELLLKAVEL